MSTVWKVAVGLVILLMLPVAAYAVGSVTAPPGAPTPRPDIRITDTPSRTPSEPARSSAGDDAPKGDDGRKPKRDRDNQDDDVRVVTPRPAPVGEDDDDDGGNRGGGDDGDDDSDDGDSGGDDD